MVGFENYLAQMIIKSMCPEQEPYCYVKGQVHSPHLNLYIGFNETNLCRAHNFVVVPTAGMVQCRDPVFHPFVRPIKALFYSRH